MKGRHPDRLTIIQARGQLALILAGCTDAALERFTVEGLAATHRVPVKEIQYQLAIARQRRAA